MKSRGVDGVMTARNKARAIMQKEGKVTEEVCELVRRVVCGDEGPSVKDLFPEEEAEEIIEKCELVCPLPGQQ
ncbi:MAG: hypothetical protein ACUVV0_16050 [Anaerolineae bacterium]